MGNQGPLESVTIAEKVLPKLDEAGWSSANRRREYSISPGGLSVYDGRVRRGAPLRADIALLHEGRPIAVVECKRSMRSVHDGIVQARKYARRLDVPLAYATNGREIMEIDLQSQTERPVNRYRSPREAWDFYRGHAGLDTGEAVALFETPYSRQVTDASGRAKEPRYYQQVAIQRLLARIAAGDKRLLVVLATGTGKTALAAQLVHVLWSNHWPRGSSHSEDRPRVLYLADRKVLIDQPIRDWFRPIFGDGPIERVRRDQVQSKLLYFALYQALDHGGDQEELFRRFPPDFFDLVIVDECHRGSASESSSWRQVLEHFSSAVQLGMTATPVERDDAVTYKYFGNPVYQYSLRDGIEDGFLAPFEVVRARLDIDIDGVVIGENTYDRDNQLIPAGTYGPAQFERKLVVTERTRTVAQYVSDFLRRNGPTGKTIVFCQDQDHAARMRQELVNLNTDLLRAYGDEWVVRITADEPDRERLLDEFAREDSSTPAVAVTSQLLSTGVDVPTARTIVLFRRVESMTEFKQIIGRGTRLAAEFGKEYFTILDFVGATRKFDDPDFDGPAVRVIDSETDEVPDPLDLDTDEDVDGDSMSEGEEAPSQGEDTPVDGGDAGEESVADPDQVDEVLRRAERYTIDGLDVCVTSEELFVMDVGSDRLRRVRYQHWVKGRVLALEREPTNLLEQWASVRGRRELREMLKDTLAFDVSDLARRLRRPDCDSIDVLIHLAWEWPLQTRAERVKQFNAKERGYLDSFSPKARQVLAMLLDKYVAHGVDELAPTALRTPPFNELGTVVELGEEFGGREQLFSAIDGLAQRLFKAS